MAMVQVNIEKLNATNYGNWSCDVKYLLLEKNSWGIVSGAEKSPKTDDIVAVKDYDSRSRTGLAIIYLNIEPEFRRIIENLDNPKEAWEKIKTHFHPDNRARHMQLFSEIFACRLAIDESIDMFASRLLRLSELLKAMNQEIKEIYLSFQLLRYLPAQYDSLVQSILRWKDEKFVFKDILTELVAEESRLKLRDLDRSNDFSIEAHATRYKYKSKPRVTCFRCKKPGHVQSQCRVRFRQQSPEIISSSTSRETSPVRPRIVAKPRRQRAKEKSYSKPGAGARRSVSPKQDKVVHFIIETNFNKINSNKDAWVFDTAASHHFCKDRDLYINFKPLYNEKMMVAVNGVTYPIEGTGMVDLKFGDETVRFGDVMYSPKLRRNLISGSRLDSRGITFKGGNGRVKASNQAGETLFRAILKDGIYYIYPKVQRKHKKVKFEACTVQKEDMKIWHRRFGHVSPNLIENTFKCNGVKGLPCVKDKDFSCETCKLNKHRRVSFKPINKIRSKHPLDLLHTDVWGPTRVSGRKGEKYFLAIVDDFSRKSSVYPLCNKSDVFRVFRNHVVRAERFLDRKVKAVRSDNGTEFANEQFRKFFEERGIKHEFTNTFSPEQNGVAERLNQTIADGVRSILNESKLSTHFWPEAVLYFVYTWNRVCHKGQLKTPFELYNGTKPSVRHLKPFGTIAYAGVPKQHRSKFDPKAKKGTLVGYAFTTKGYRIWLPESNKIIETINVRFSEDVTGCQRRNGAVLGHSFNFDPLNSETSVNVDPFEHEYHREDDSNTQSQDQPSDSEVVKDVASKVPLREAVWLRKAVPRKTGARTDIYYFEQGQTERLRSLREIREYCIEHEIKFEPYLFSFKGADKYEGIVQGKSGSSSSDSPSSSPNTDTDDEELNTDPELNFDASHTNI